MMMTTETDSEVPRAHPFIVMMATTLTIIVVTQKFRIEITLWVKFLVAMHKIIKAKSNDKKIPETAES